MTEVCADEDVTPADKALATACLHVLHLAYPGWAWTVNTPPNQNILKVQNLDMDPKGTYGMVFHKTNLSGSNIAKTMVRAGGELLERWNTARRPYSPDAIEGRMMILEKPETP